jgi:alpha-L-fucosidase
MAAMIHELQPGTLINNRLGVAADYGTPEQRIPNASSVEPFEVCMTLNKHWGYNRFDHDWKNPTVVVRNIADIVSKGGNYLLNVGPTAEGVIPLEAVAILQQVGAWTSLNAEAIYGAGGTPFGAELGGDDWRCTTQPGKLYFHLLKWPGEKFTVPGLANKVIKAYFLADPAHAPVAATADAHGTTFTLPAQPPAALAPVLCVEIEGSVKPASNKGKLDTTKDTAS